MNSSLCWKLPYELRRRCFEWSDPIEYKRLQFLRNSSPEQTNEPTFKPILDKKCLFVHIPKAAGISIGKAIFGRNTGNHTFVSQYQIAFSKKEFNSMFKFSFVRNPWDRLYSAYTFLSNGGRNENDKKWFDHHLGEYKDFESFVLDWVNNRNIELGIHFIPQYKFLTNPGSTKLKVDFVGRYESIDSDWEFVKSQIELEGILAKVNESIGRKNDFRDCYSNKMKAVVAEAYYEDTRLFKYKFGD